MNRVIKVYADLDSFYDYRRGLLQWIMTEGITDDTLRKREGDRLWAQHMDQNYKERRMDTFEFPHLKINSETFKKAYQERSLTNFLMYYPTNLSRELLRRVMELEQMTDRPLDISGFVLYVNLAPYAFDEELTQQFIDHCFTLYGGRVDVRVLNEDVRKAEPSFYRQFDYVFKYNILHEECKTFMEHIHEQSNPNTTFVVPDILVREVDALQGSILDRIYAWSLTIATVVKFIPIAHAFYDFEETK